MNALAFTSGNDIVFAGLPRLHTVAHEAAHVVQQRAGVRLAGGVGSAGDVYERNADAVADAVVAGRSAEALLAPFDEPDTPQRTVQRKQHVFIGAMLDYAPPNPPDDAAIDAVNKITYGRDDVVGSPRGELRPSVGTHDWPFAALVARVASMRRAAGQTADDFPVFVNANRMVSPGYETAPAPSTHDNVNALSSVWGFRYRLPNKIITADYAIALQRWAECADMSADRPRAGQSAPPLGMSKAKQLLSAHAAEKRRDSPNLRIPHRSLRNLITGSPAFQECLASKSRPDTIVHVMTLDSDTTFESPNVLREIAAAADQRPSSAVHVTAIDYIYTRDNIFAWFAGALDKVARFVLEQKGVDAYPAEPGLTISFGTDQTAAAKKFLEMEPYGHDASDPKEDGFKDFDPSEQSVEGKNLRAKWRAASDDQKLRPHRTLGALSVIESDSRRVKPTTLAPMLVTLLDGRPIGVESVRTLVHGDSYHALAPERNGQSANARRKIAAQDEIIEETTKILNAVINDKPDLLTRLKSDPNFFATYSAEMKLPLMAALTEYMKRVQTLLPAPPLPPRSASLEIPPPPARRTVRTRSDAELSQPPSPAASSTTITPLDATATKRTRTETQLERLVANGKRELAALAHRFRIDTEKQDYQDRLRALASFESATDVPYQRLEQDMAALLAAAESRWSSMLVDA